MHPKNLSWLKTELIAHRGLHSKDGRIPENSRSAFQHALDHVMICYRQTVLKKELMQPFNIQIMIFGYLDLLSSTQCQAIAWLHGMC